jgi:hypothetical protein
MISVVRAAGGLIVCGLLLAACAGASTSEKPMLLSPEADLFLQIYLNGGHQGRSALAVTEDGARTFEAYCNATCNGQYNISQEAINGCEKFGHGRCVILASNGVARRPYEVDPVAKQAFKERTAQALYEAGIPRFATEERIRQALIGNSIVLTNDSGETWAEYYDTDGTIHGRDWDGTEFAGNWKIDGNTLCADYSSVGEDWCGQFVEHNDGSIAYYKDGKFQKTYLKSILKPGNPQQL